MFAGHLAVALAAKAKEPRAPLGGLVAASYGIDLIWPVLLLAGVESVSIEPGATAFTPLGFESYPWSHSLAMVLVWGAMAFIAGRLLCRSWAIATMLGAVLVSHWVLDLVTHRPDLPLWPNGPALGLGLWNSVPGTLIVEGGLLAACLLWYARRFPARDRWGQTGLVAMVTLVAAIWAMGPFMPPPPSETAVATVGLALWVFPIWAWRMERHRRFGEGSDGVTPGVA